MPYRITHTHTHTFEDGVSDKILCDDFQQFGQPELGAKKGVYIHASQNRRDPYTRIHPYQKQQKPWAQFLRRYQRWLWVGGRSEVQKLLIEGIAGMFEPKMTMVVCAIRDEIYVRAQERGQLHSFNMRRGDNEDFVYSMFCHPYMYHKNWKVQSLIKALVTKSFLQEDYVSVLKS